MSKEHRQTKRKEGEVKMVKVMAVVALAVMLIPSVASANLLVNGGFEGTGENGHMTGWANEYNANIAGTQDNPRSGLYAARNGWDGGVYQNVAITAGTAYRLTGWSYIPSGVGGSPWGTYIGVKFLNSTGGTVLAKQLDMQNLARDVYNQADTGTLVAPSNAVTAMVRFGTWASDPWIPVNPTDFDDFDLSPVPEPTSLMLLGSGLVGLVGLTRKKRA